MVQIIFFLNVPGWDEQQKSSMILNLFEPFPIEMSLCNYENLLVLGGSLFEYVRTEWMLFKYHIKIWSKNKHKEKSNSLNTMNRNILNRSKSMKVLHKRKMKFWTIAYMKECCYAYKIYTKILLHIGNYNILQYTILRQSLRHAASLLGNN